MAKNYATIYNSGNDSISLEQRFYLKEETTRGTLASPMGSDFFFHLPGGQISFAQPFESSPQRSGRHHSKIIKKKKTAEWNFSTYFNLDLSVAAGITELDQSLRTLWTSLLGVETIPGGVVYTPATAPDLTFSLYEVSDKWSRQSPGAFVQGGNATLPGDGEAMIEWSGNAKTAYVIGIAKSTAANTTNDIVLESGEASRMMIGGSIMIIEADGTTRSADTPDGSPRTITAVDEGTDTITVDGAVLTDADGSVTPIYVSYYEPESPTAVSDNLEGLTGSVSIVGLSQTCFRSLNINMQNNHELVDYCYGEDGLGGALYVPGDRLTTELSLSMNLNDNTLPFFVDTTQFVAKNITAILGDATGRHVKFEIPNAYFQVPAFAVPDTGSIPMEFSGTAYETAFEAADEVTVSYL